ncbi:MAG: hypothetical protein DBY18_03200 [Clostridia bacterium]|nr:MAG: hypothetical protein DBY18_03200 [Clostridia bacterium]
MSSTVFFCFYRELCTRLFLCNHGRRQSDAGQENENHEGNLRLAVAGGRHGAAVATGSAAGRAGAIGRTGTAGRTGAVGRAGTAGRTGAAGRTGTVGRTGAAGRAGTAGRAGAVVCFDGQPIDGILQRSRQRVNLRLLRDVRSGGNGCGSVCLCRLQCRDAFIGVCRQLRRNGGKCRIQRGEVGGLERQCLHCRVQCGSGSVDFRLLQNIQRHCIFCGGFRRVQRGDAFISIVVEIFRNAVERLIQRCVVACLRCKRVDGGFEVCHIGVNLCLCALRLCTHVILLREQGFHRACRRIGIVRKRQSVKARQLRVERRAVGKFDCGDAERLERALTGVVADEGDIAALILIGQFNSENDIGL